MKIHTRSYLPHDVVENILCRLPVKSLLRLKAVCKQWSATISDPIFAHTHLQQSKNSFCSFLHLSRHALRRVTFENKELRELSPLQLPLRQIKLMCYCDGLFLISLSYYRADYVVWNPARRRTYKELHYPYAVDPNSNPRIGIYYNSLVKDYKVVIVGAEHNVVFSCKNNSWSEMRTNAISFNNCYDCVGVPYDESIYWIRCPAILEDWHTHLPTSQIEIVCFDGKDEKLKILCNLDCAHDDELFTSRDGLYVISSRPTEMVIKKILPVWMMEHKVKLPFSYMYPLGFIQQNKVLFLQFFGERKCLLYDYSGRCFTETIIHPSFNFSGFRLLPYIESLFLL